MTMMSDTTDPNHLYDLKGKADSAQVYYQTEIDAFAKIFYNREVHLLEIRGSYTLLLIPPLTGSNSWMRKTR
jgi:type I restriction enzyme R subunit